MKIKIYYGLFLCFLIIFTSLSYAVERLPDNLIKLTSQQGVDLLEGNLNANTVKLLSHFTTQKTTTYCGVASVVMVLNATDITPPIDSQHIPYQYFTQNNFFNNAVKKIITPDIVQKEGITLTELNKIAQSYGLKSEAHFANKISLDSFRQQLISALSNHQFIIVNFLRAKLQQPGGGHHSPIAAYNNKADRFLILDVARYKYPAYWVKTEDLWQAVNTMDGNKSRGFLVITSDK